MERYLFKKAILIGNVMTSQLIDEYKDCNMNEKIKTEISGLYSEINDMLNPYRNLKLKDEKNVTRLLEESGIEYHNYQMIAYECILYTYDEIIKFGQL